MAESVEHQLAVHRLVEDALNRGDVDDVVADLVAASAVDHGPALVGTGHGAESVKTAFRALRRAMPDLRVEIEYLSVESDEASVRWVLTGTLDGELGGVAATGRSARVTGTVIYRFEGGVIVESWGNWDALGFMTQVGAIEQPQADPKLG